MVVIGAGESIKGGNAGAMAHWVEACGIVGVGGAVVWGRHARRFGVCFTGGCFKGGVSKDDGSTHIVLMILAYQIT